MAGWSAHPVRGREGSGRPFWVVVHQVWRDGLGVERRDGSRPAEFNLCSGRAPLSPNRHNSPRRPTAPGVPAPRGPLRMFSLQTIFGQGNQFYTLLEEAAVAAHDSTK